MSDTLRTFIALPIEYKYFKNDFTALTNRLDNEKIKWVEPNNMHITLHFLGDTPAHLVKNISESLATINIPQITLDFSGIGYFSKGKFPRVLFIKTEKNLLLQTVHSQIKKNISTFIELPEEKREFIPHLTLGRIKYIKDLKKFYDTVNEFSENFRFRHPINKIIFFKSILTPEGPIYEPLYIKTLE
jgi:2'-5' RNA ligase